MLSARGLGISGELSGSGEKALGRRTGVGACVSLVGWLPGLGRLSGLSGERSKVWDSDQQASAE